MSIFRNNYNFTEKALINKLSYSKISAMIVINNLFINKSRYIKITFLTFYHLFFKKNMNVKILLLENCTIIRRI